jgi:PAS domain S-box-containing protein
MFLIITLAFRAWDDVGNLTAAKSDNMQWTLSQLEVDYLNLKIKHKDATEGKAQSLEQLREKFDVFYSRVSTFVQSPLYNALKKDSTTGTHLNSIWDFLQISAPVIDAADNVLVSKIGDLSEGLAELEDDIKAVSLSGVGLFAGISDQQRNDVSQSMALIALSTLALFTALLVLLWVLVRQYRHMKTQSGHTQIASSRLNAVVTSSLDAVIVINRAAEIIEFNAAAEKIFGFTKDEAVGGDLATMIVPDHFRRAHKEGMQRYLDTGEKRVVGQGRVQLEAQRKSGEVFPVELSISSAESHEGEIFVAFLRDISDRVAAREELMLARDDALAGEKAKAELLAVMSHEMRTPLNGMLGTLELMQDTHISGRQRQYLDIIGTSGQMLLHHVNDVLDISRLDSGKFEIDLKKFDLAQLMIETCNSQRPNAEANANRLQLNFEAVDNQIVIGDDVRLRQIILNILGNAIKFTRNGHITVEMERMMDDTDFVEIRVYDTGIGMVEADLDKIFEDFVTLDSSYKRSEAGTGLGLGITKRMVEAVGGTIGVESEKDEGSLFWVRLPLPEIEGVEASLDNKEAEPKVALEPQRILIVEDNRINRFVAREMLERDGHTVVEAHDGEEGAAFSMRQHFDLILMDISMPRMDGITATKVIREGKGNSKDTPIIALTAHALPNEIVKFKDSGMNEVLIKPISISSLRNAMLLALKGEELIDQEEHQIDHNALIDPEILDQLIGSLGKTKSRKFLTDFKKETDVEIDWMSKQNLDDMDTVHFVQRVHSLAGSASIFGAARLRHSLSDIETRMKSESLDGLAERLVELAEIWQETKKKLI